MKNGTKVMLATPCIKLGNPKHNANCFKKIIDVAIKNKAEFAIFGHNSLCGNTAGDMVLHPDIAKSVQESVQSIHQYVKDSACTTVFSTLYLYDGTVQPCTVICNGQDLLIYPIAKSYMHQTSKGTNFGVCIGDDIDDIAIAKNTNCHLIINLDAKLALSHTNANIQQKLAQLSHDCDTTIVYTSTGKGESASVGVHGGYKIVANCGNILSATDFEKEYAIVSIDDHTVSSNPKTHNFDNYKTSASRIPFVDANKDYWDDILSILKYGTYQRLKETHAKGAIIGVSGGLDSAFALMLAVATKQTYPDFGQVCGVTMHSFATSQLSNDNASALIQALGVQHFDIPIKQGVSQVIKDIAHDTQDTTYENAHARYRSLLLQTLANKHGLLHLGTGDMSEIALGFSTYGGDQLAHFNPNSNLTKTMIQVLLPRLALCFDTPVQDLAHKIVQAPISPELVPNQKTEELLGPYDFFDFVLYNFVFGQCSIDKLVKLCKCTFLDLSNLDITRYISKFITRFFANQFKRLYACDGLRVQEFDLNTLTIRSDFDPSVLLDQLNSLN